MQLSFIVFSSFLVILAQCEYPMAANTYPTPPPTYPTSPSYPVPKKYPTAEYPAASYTSISEFSSDSDDTTSTSEFRQRAKARTAHNRQFQRRALQPIRRFQQKKQ